MAGSNAQCRASSTDRARADQRNRIGCHVEQAGHRSSNSDADRSTGNSGNHRHGRVYAGRNRDADGHVNYDANRDASRDADSVADSASDNEPAVGTGTRSGIERYKDRLLARTIR